MSQIYNDPVNAAPSTIGTQIRTDFYAKKALIDAAKLQFFTPLADVTAMPKHYGKKIKQFLYIPMLDDRNVNDQGIDAAGVTIATTQSVITFPTLTPAVTNATKVAATATINANVDSATGTAVVVAVAGADDSGGVGLATITLSKPSIKYATGAPANAVVALNLGVSVQAGSGNIYGSSKDIGSISAKLPALSETGGRVNRVGFKRVELEGTMEKFGFFDEYTQESLDFDTDEDLEMHINREMLAGATEMTEDALQIDLLNAATTYIYAGVATTKATINGVAATLSKVDYSDLSRLETVLDENRTPKSTKVINGSRMVDTRTIAAARVMYIGSELKSIIEKMTDHFGNQAFVPIHQYAAAGAVLNGEIGSIGGFRIVVVPEMLHWAGAGMAEGVNAGYRTTNGRYNVYPMLVVGDGSFTTIGFQTDGKSTKFKVYHKKPGEATADKTDPYGETGFMSIKWWYGFMALRPERIGLIYTVAEQ